MIPSVKKADATPDSQIAKREFSSRLSSLFTDISGIVGRSDENVYMHVILTVE